MTDEQKFDKELADRHYRCPICNKVFYLPWFMSPEDYVYKVSIKDKQTKKTNLVKCCSYTCYSNGLKQK